ncbi:hypothetical protein EHS25_009273 [Saitozyma podzolica]|uniref:Uncharacterized protein n=1 Tax=Saitozyma podzolica TaxID=1890683 RepID=A0A427YLD7_9TREE|nr:hypothetical protein EHS25_009273 [Saitozyma podzolica]
MAQPAPPSAPGASAKPPALDPSNTYIHITSPSSPSSLSSLLSSALSALPDAGSRAGTLRYVGPVGELKGEHIFEVVGPDGPVRTDSPLWKESQGGIMGSIKSAEGVKGAKVMEMRQRAKRDEL